MRLIKFLAGFALLSFAFPIAAVAEPVSQSVISKVRTLDFQGVNLGMTIDEMRQELEKQGYVPGNDRSGRKHYLMQYTREGDSADGVSHTVTARFYANMRGITDPHPHFIEYFSKYRPPAIFTRWEDARGGMDAQKIVAALCGKSGDKVCRNSQESETRLRIVFPQTRSDFDGRLYNFEMDVMAGAYKVMVSVTAP